MSTHEEHFDLGSHAVIIAHVVGSEAEELVAINLSKMSVVDGYETHLG